MAKLAHSMIRVFDEAASVKFYEDVFGLKIADRLDFDSFTLIYLRDATGAFELDRETAYDLGDGYGHLAFVVDDLEAARETAIKGGATPREIVDFRPAGETVAKFFFVADPDGYQIEVIEKGGRFA